jgi:anti-anti-sigma regulatory factor/HAMP domain-containing protein
MRLHTKFGFYLGGFFLLFWTISSIALYYYFRNQVEQQTFVTAHQIVTQVDATQRYVREVLRPVMFELVSEDDFVPEGMSTTFVSRNTIERFRETYPDYYFKFATSNPRNLVNLADEVEQQIIEQFENNADFEKWQGIIERDEQPYFSVATPIRFEESCMQCHGNPEDAPLSLRQRYGDTNGFYRHEGEVAIKSVGIPLAEALETARNRTLTFAGSASLFLTGLFGLSFFFFRSLVTRPLKLLQLGATQIGKGQLDYSVEIEKEDEIGELSTAFNNMITQLREMIRSEQAQRQTLEAQQQAIQELSTPVIPVMDHIIVMPLTGSIDSMRARDITRALLAGISTHRAKVVIVDITGVSLVDSGVASHLNKTIQAARLKGAHTIVTGISDAVAETIVDLGIDWSEIETLSNLQTGLITALKRLGVELSQA